MKFMSIRLPKLCHATPGQIIRVPEMEGKFMVCVVNIKNKRAARNISKGLYDDERPLFIVNIETGEALAMPHLSTRVEIIDDIAVVENASLMLPHVILDK